MSTEAEDDAITGGAEPEAAKILVVDDEESMRVFLRRALERAGYDVQVESEGRAAMRHLSESSCDLLLTDIRMPEMDGLSLLDEVRRRFSHLPVLMMTAQASIPDAVDAMRRGAQNYVTKPFDRQLILKAVDDALATGRLSAENRMLRRLLEEGRRFEGLVGSSAPMRALYRQIDQVAPREGVVLIRGESGTGKELVARAIHARSTRSPGAFVAFHCAAVPAALLAAELFGVEEGAFTGARKSRRGAVGRAEGGTLFLDEIGELPLDLQPTLLRLLESGEVVSLGGKEARRPELRILAATNRDLVAEVEAGRFRRDLYYRLNVFPLEVPPLRQRREDLADLVRHFLALAGHDEEAIDLETLALLESRTWPGNVRELENTVARMVALAGGGRIGPEQVPEELRAAEEPSTTLPPFRAAVADFERSYLEKLLAATEGNVSEAARRAGVSRPALHAKLQALGIDPDRYR
jgi:DNA-binding NtrC family response regulator